MCDMVLEGDATGQTNPDPGLAKLRSDSLECPQDRSNGTLPGQHRCSRDFGYLQTLPHPYAGFRHKATGLRHKRCKPKEAKVSKVTPKDDEIDSIDLQYWPGRAHVCAPTTKGVGVNPILRWRFQKSKPKTKQRVNARAFIDTMAQFDNFKFTTSTIGKGLEPYRLLLLISIVLSFKSVNYVNFWCQCVNFWNRNAVVLS